MPHAVGRDRDLARAVDAGGGGAALGGNVRVGLEDNFYLPDGEMARSNGDLVAQARRMAEDVGRRPATVAEARAMLGAARPPTAALRGRARRRRRERPLAGSACSTSRGCCRAASARCCSPTSAPTCSRSRTPAWATTSAGRRPTTRGPSDSGRRRALLPRAQPRQALDPARPQDRRRARGAAAARARARRAARVLPAGRDGPARRRLRARCARRTRGSSTARSPATGRTARYRDRSGHDMNYLGAGRPARADRASADGPPVQAAGQIADLGGGALMAAFGILAALRERERSGEGQLVDVSMADGALSWLAMVAARYFAERRACRSAASSSWRAGSSATGPTVRGRLGHARRARAEVLAGVVPRRRARGPDRAAVRPARLGRRTPRSRRIFLERTRDEWAGVRRRARLLPRAGARARRGARLRARARARDGGRARPAGRRAARCGCSACR